MKSKNKRSNIIIKEPQTSDKRMIYITEITKAKYADLDIIRKVAKVEQFGSEIWRSILTNFLKRFQHKRARNNFKDFNLPEIRLYFLLLLFPINMQSYKKYF